MSGIFLYMSASIMCHRVEDKNNIKFIGYYLSYHKNNDLVLAHIGNDVFTRLFTAVMFAKEKSRKQPKSQVVQGTDSWMSRGGTEKEKSLFTFYFAYTYERTYVEIIQNIKNNTKYQHFKKWNSPDIFNTLEYSSPISSSCLLSEIIILNFAFVIERETFYFLPFSV